MLGPPGGGGRKFFFIKNDLDPSAVWGRSLSLIARVESRKKPPAHLKYEILLPPAHLQYEILPPASVSKKTKFWVKNFCKGDFSKSVQNGLKREKKLGPRRKFFSKSGSTFGGCWDPRGVGAIFKKIKIDFEPWDNEMSSRLLKSME